MGRQESSALREGVDYGQQPLPIIAKVVAWHRERRKKKERKENGKIFKKLQKKKMSTSMSPMPHRITNIHINNFQLKLIRRIIVANYQNV